MRAAQGPSCRACGQPPVPLAHRLSPALPCQGVGGELRRRVGGIVRLVLRKILLSSALRNSPCLAGSSVALRLKDFHFSS